jgi:predicted ATPase
VPQAVATVLGVKEQAGKGLAQTLCDAVRAQPLLLILDNADHLFGACAQLVDTMLRASEQLVILVTTRERLGIAGELTYRVPSLAVPDTTQEVSPEGIAACESVQLFVERARLQRPHFGLSRGNAIPVAAICKRLDGIPLAIELAAARVRSMSVQEVSQRLDQRFSLLAGGSHTAVPRHRRLRSLIDWSYDLLSGSEKLLLNRVAVFAGGCTLKDAEQVCSGEGIEARDVLDLLAALADKSLLIADEHDGASRYRMLETIRHYARDRLRDSGEETQVQRRHLHCFSALADEFNASVGGPALPALLTRLDMEHDNVRAALAWSTTADGDAAGGLVLVSRLAWFWSFRGYLGEGRAWLSALLAMAPSEQDPEVRAKSLVGASVLAAQQGDDAAAEALCEESLAITASFLERFAAVVAAMGGPERAARIWGGVERLREEVGAPMPKSDRARYDRQIEAGRAALRDDVAFDEAWRAGRAMTAAQTVRYALETWKVAAAVSDAPDAADRSPQ